MFCSQCVAEIQDGYAFCTECGTPVYAPDNEADNIVDTNGLDSIVDAGKKKLGNVLEIGKEKAEILRQKAAEKAKDPKPLKIDPEKKEKAKRVGKIVGSAAWSAFKGMSKQAFHAANGIFDATQGDELSADYHHNREGSGNGDLHEAFGKLAQLKHINDENFDETRSQKNEILAQEKEQIQQEFEEEFSEYWEKRVSEESYYNRKY